MFIKFAKTLLVSALFAASAIASAQSIQNGSFETTVPSLADGASTQSFTGTSWTKLSPIPGNNGVFITNPADATANILAEDGQNFLQLKLDTNGVSQTITGLNTSAWAYRITYYTNGSGGKVSITNALASKAGSGSATSFVSGLGTQTFLANADTIDLPWVQHFIDFRATAGSTFLTFKGDAGNAMTYVDNVTIAAIPEPESYAMLLAGLGAIGFMSRRRRANQG
jgi:hypothetical protein